MRSPETRAPIFTLLDALIEQGLGNTPREQIPPDMIRYSVLCYVSRHYRPAASDFLDLFS